MQCQFKCFISGFFSLSSCSFLITIPLVLHYFTLLNRKIKTGGPLYVCTTRMLLKNPSLPFRKSSQFGRHGYRESVPSWQIEDWAGGLVYKGRVFYCIKSSKTRYSCKQSCLILTTFSRCRRLVNNRRCLIFELSGVTVLNVVTQDGLLIRLWYYNISSPHQSLMNSELLRPSSLVAADMTMIVCVFDCEFLVPPKD